MAALFIAGISLSVFGWMVQNRPEPKRLQRNVLQILGVNNQAQLLRRGAA